VEQATDEHPDRHSAGDKNPTTGAPCSQTDRDSQDRVTTSYASACRYVVGRDHIQRATDFLMVARVWAGMRNGT
jgi:hypothetical protein